MVFSILCSLGVCAAPVSVCFVAYDTAAATSPWKYGGHTVQETAAALPVFCSLTLCGEKH